MAPLVIRCPRTGKSLYTGIDMDARSFQDPTNQLTNMTVGPCPQCGQNHTWSKEDAYLGEER
jgi:hypothetical protein